MAAHDKEYYDYNSITQDGKLIPGEEKPENWAVHYHKIVDDDPWTDQTYTFEAKINPKVSFEETKQAISQLRENNSNADPKILSFLEKMVAKGERSTSINLFKVK